MAGAPACSSRGSNRSSACRETPSSRISASGASRVRSSGQSSGDIRGGHDARIAWRRVRERARKLSDARDHVEPAPAERAPRDLVVQTPGRPRRAPASSRARRHAAAACRVAASMPERLARRCRIRVVRVVDHRERADRHPRAAHRQRGRARDSRRGILDRDAQRRGPPRWRASRSEGCARRGAAA